MTELPNWLIPLPNAQAMREADRCAIEELGISGVRLMESAAEALAEGVLNVAPNGRVLVVAGKGNNGGDGLAAARILRDRGRDVDVVATCAPEDWIGDSAEMMKLLTGHRPMAISGADGDYSCVVDCLLGTGASGAPRGKVLDAIDLINTLAGNGSVVVSCDIPSGVNASTGEVQGTAVRADVTVTFHAMKPGLWIRPGKGFAGAVTLADIGIPNSVDVEASVGLIKESVVLTLPRRAEADDKFSVGSVTVLGGSPGLTGAPMLAALGAARAGAGYVTAALPKALLAASDAQLEVMGLGLTDEDGSHCAEGVAEVASRSGVGRALVLGPGLGRSTQAQAAVRAVVEQAEGPVVVDADGLNAFAQSPALLAETNAELVLTPHVGEIAALLGRQRDEIEEARLQSALDLSALAKAVVVLKGDDTLVATPDGQIAVSEGNAPALATAGSGDVLSGVIGALLARGAEAFQAACAGVLIHLEAGRLAAGDGLEGVIAGDIAAALPAGRKRLETADR